MASTIKLKRSAVSGNAPTTSNIAAGELALNTADGILYSTDGSGVFEIGANLSSLAVSGQVTLSNIISANGSVGTAGQALVTDGSSKVYWGTITPEGAAGSKETFYYTSGAGDTTFSGADNYSNVADLDTTYIDVFLNGILIANSNYTSNTTAVVFNSGLNNNDIVTIVASNIIAGELVRTYVYSANGTQTVFSGTDLNSQTLSMTSNYTDVYVNGLLIYDNTNNYTSNSSAVTFQTTPNQNDIITIKTYDIIPGRAALTGIDDNSTATTITIDTSNRVGINETTPAYNLDVGGSLGVNSLYIGDVQVTATAAELNLLDGVTATTAELNYTDGVTSNIQTQLDAKLALSGGTMTGNIVMSGAQTVDGRDLSADGTKLDGIESGATADQTASEILTALLTVDGAASGLDADLLDGQHGSYYAPIASPTFTGTLTYATLNDGTTSLTATVAELNTLDGITATTAELNYTDGVTSNIQTQLDAKAPLASPAFTGTATGVNLTLSGNLTVNGTTTTLSTTNTVVSDNLIELNNGVTSNANDSGIVIERGSTGDNAFMGWDESADSFILGTTTATGASTGDLTITAAPLSVSTLTTSGNITVGGTVDGRDVATDGTKLDGIETGATADQTASEILTALLTVDGASSGLDADLLDGQHGSYYAPIASPTFTGTVTYATLNDGTTSLTATVAELNTLDGITATTAELNYTDGVTSNIQTQLDAKAPIASPTFTGTVTYSILNDGTTDLTATVAELNTLDGITATTSELNILDGVTATASELNLLDGVTATTTELNYTDGVTSNIQTQLDAKIDETSSTGSAVIPSGTTAQRDGSPSAGYLRFNTTDSSFEGYDGSAWGAIGGGGSATTNHQELDDISSGFNGNDTAFSLTVSSSAVSPTSAAHLLISINGIIQEPTTVYTVSGSTITFTTAPQSGDTFFGIFYESLNIGTPGNGTVGTAQLSSANIAFDTSTLFIDSTNNRVGIGTTSPSEKLTVDAQAADGSTTTIASFHSNEGETGDTAIQLAVVRSDALGSGRKTFLNTTGAGNFEIQRNGTTAAAIDGAGKVGIGTTSPAATLDVRTASDRGLYIESTTSNPVYLRSYQGSTSSNLREIGLKGTNIRFETGASSGTTTSEAMRIDSSGNVGIGTTSPNYTSAGRTVVDVNGSSQALISLSYGGTAGAYLHAYSTDTVLWSEGSRNLTIGTASAGPMILKTNNAERVRIDSSGNVGIGTTSPAYTFDLSSTTAGYVSRFKSTGNYAGVIADAGTAGSVGGGYFAPMKGGTRAGVFGTTGAVKAANETNLAVWAETGKQIEFFTNGSTTASAIIDTSGNVGIGTSSVTGKLNVKSTYSSGTTVQQRFEDNTGAALDFGGTASGEKWINAADVGTPSTGYPIIFRTGGTERMRILSGGGLTFNGDTATANALDDYEEGSFTPALSATGWTFAYTTQEGTYVKIGKLVACSIYIRPSSSSGSGVTQLRISNLPFTIDNTNNSSYTASAMVIEGSGATFSGVPVFRPGKGSTQGVIFDVVGGQSPSINCAINQITSSTEFELQVTYIVN